MRLGVSSLTNERQTRDGWMGEIVKSGKRNSRGWRREGAPGGLGECHVDGYSVGGSWESQPFIDIGKLERSFERSTHRGGPDPWWSRLRWGT
ncbi:uncharacterized protein G2W53_002260 [Senna tora]|uniref:Uncharacterized protein n=1 Tax=Senna tora TaxID=362788 RepID=A0A835CMA2_9FABA|nr:uncharacterized protein G2W53_002260 [Senna tora]